MSEGDNIFDEDIGQVMAKCYADSRKTAKVFFPKRFYRPFTSVHDEVFKLIDKKPGDPGYKPRKLIVLPRGLGKTSIANMLLPAKKALFQETHYIVPVSATADLAQQQSENMKSKILNNKRIETLFGDMTTNTLNKKQWVVRVGGAEGDEDSYEICFMPRGSGQQIRGLLYEDYRPGLIVVDDLEDPEDLLSEKQRAKQKRWFWGDLMQSVDNYAPVGEWEVIVIGTVVHENALITDLMESDDWDKAIFRLCDEDLKSNIPEWASDEWVKNKYEELKREGQVSTFYREYMNMPTAGGEDADFSEEYYQDYDPGAKNLNYDPEVESLVLVDVARTTNEQSTDSAVVGVGVNMKTQAIYVRDIVHGKLHPDELYDEMFRMCSRLDARVLGVEITGLHEFAVYPIKNEMARRGLDIELVELPARGGRNQKGKKERIATLIPFYRQGLVFHNPSCCAVLEAQLSSFPHAKRWDVMDALGYVPAILEIGERYMEPEGYEDMDDRQTVEEEFKELEREYYDRPLENFRTV